MSLFYRPAWNLSSSCLSLQSMLLKAYPPSLATGQTHFGLYQLFSAAVWPWFWFCRSFLYHRVFSVSVLELTLWSS